jgi:uncharacterized protein (UPF0262 family)
MACDISLIGMPKSIPATIEMIKKARKGFILPQDMRRMSRMTHKITMGMDIKDRLIGL